MVMRTLSVIVRFHDLGRLFEVRRCILSLVCQSYEPLEICLVTQRFSAADLTRLRHALNPTLDLNKSVILEIHNYHQQSPADARSALLNLGMERRNGRYLAFLDHDDTILHDGYRSLIQELEKSEAAIAFASIAYKVADVFEGTLLVNKRLEAFVGNSLADLFDHNFCPIHSFVIDTERVESTDFGFDTTLQKHEDYEFLLRLCAKYKSSFNLIGSFVGDYYLKDDESNSNTWLAEDTPQISEEWKRSLAMLSRRKAEIVIAAAIQNELGLLTKNSSLTISQFLSLEGHVMMGLDDHT